MKITVVCVLLIDAVNFLNAWDINLACRPTWDWPISPSISDLGTNAATESIITISTPPDSINISAISSACSPVSGWETNNSSMSTPSAPAYTGSNACSASINAATPPAFWASAATCKDKVVLPELSGP